MTMDLLGLAALVRTLGHPDASCLAEALTRSVLDPDAPIMEEMIGLKHPGMNRKRSDVRRLIVGLADHYNAELAKVGGWPMAKTTMATRIIQEAKRCEPSFNAYRESKVLPANEPDLSLVLLMATHGGKRRGEGVTYLPDMQTIASIIDAGG